jgi:hypothetical protein
LSSLQLLPIQSMRVALFSIISLPNSVFVRFLGFAQFRTQNRCTLLLELL